MNDRMQQYDDCFEINLDYPKIQEIMFLTSSSFLIIHAPRQFTIIQVVCRSETNVLKQGNLPLLAESIKKYNHQTVAFILENEFHLFSLYLQKSTHIYSIARSSIYNQQFLYEFCGNQSERMCLHYKTSILKSDPITIYYQVHLLLVSEQFEKLKKLKIEYQDLRKFGYSCGEIFSYQTTGYEIEINFIESNITHKINSIFNLFLIEVNISGEHIQFNYTHQELEHQISSFSVTKKKVVKLDRKIRTLELHTIKNESKLRTLVFKNCYNRRTKDPHVGIFLMKMAKQSKYLNILNEIVPEGDKDFKNTVLNLLS